MVRLSDPDGASQPIAWRQVDSTLLKPDGFGPPAESCQVECIHCGEVYDSDRIEWRVFADAAGDLQGFWCCPIEDCDGIGFCFDIYPADAETCARYGVQVFEDEDDEDLDIDDVPPSPSGRQVQDDDMPF